MPRRAALRRKQLCHSSSSLANARSPTRCDPGLRFNPSANYRRLAAGPQRRRKFLECETAGHGHARSERDTSRVPSEGMNANRLAAASDAVERIRAWSWSFDMRMTNRVLYCEIIMGSISAGRCVTNPRNTLHPRPSFAIRDNAAVRTEADFRIGRSVTVRLFDKQERGRRHRSTTQNRTPCGRELKQLNRSPPLEIPPSA